MESGHSCKSKATCGHACCDRHLNLQTEIAPFAPHQRSEASEVRPGLQSQPQSFPGNQQSFATHRTANLASQTASNQGSAAISKSITAAAPPQECGHKCTSKAKCGHECCKRHLPAEVQAAWWLSRPTHSLQAQLSGQPYSVPYRQVAGLDAHDSWQNAQQHPQQTVQPSATLKRDWVSNPFSHSSQQGQCRDKASCLHTCCKRHLAAAASTGPTPPANAATIPPTRPAGVDAAFMKSIEQLAAAMKTNPGRPVSQSVPARSGARHDQNKAGPSQPQSQPEDSLELVSSDHKAQADTAPLHPATDRTAAGVDAPESSGLKPVAEANGRHSTGASYQDLQYEFFAFDLETTGLSPDNDRIMEIAVKHVPDRPVSESALSPAYVTLVNSGQRPNMGAYRVHKISHREATENGKPFRQVWAEMLTYVGEHCQPGTTPVLVAHNGFRFDNKILQAECARINQPLPGHWMCLDTLPLARQMLPDLASHSQAALQRAFDIPEATLQHRAKEDVEMLEQVLWKLGGSLAALMQPAAPHCGSLVTGKEPSKGASQGLQGRSEKRSSS
ncbi:hypothetical protein WJX84_002461 [Apatococcus fuscideae]|uniref:Exonuclease domain-containing protein n=1 Tax=Apatococcus fuscideae TaxID=2026836 RepID=A0AAW1TD39_9CHLO